MYRYNFINFINLTTSTKWKFFNKLKNQNKPNNNKKTKINQINKNQNNHPL